MLHIITGRIGSGKTYEVHKLIAGQVNNGETGITLIVPEQFSFATEKMMLERLGAAGFSCVDIFSFSRLAEKLVPPAFLAGKKPLNSTARTALMGMALDEVKDKLTLFGNLCDNPSVVSSFLSVRNEMKTGCVTTDMLRKAASSLRTSNINLSKKLEDICLVTDAYDAEESRSYFDSSDIMDYLCDVLDETRYFTGRCVYIDSFRGFTAQELKVIEKMLRDAKAVYVTLTMNEPGEVPDTDLFAHTESTRQKLVSLAAKAGTGVAKPLNLSLGNKFCNFPHDIPSKLPPELKALEKNLFDPLAGEYSGSCEGITVCTSPDIYAECELVACTVKKLIREEGYRCRDIAIIARMIDGYEMPMRSALRKCGVSVFEDRRRGVSSSPLMNFVMSAVSVAAHGFTSESVFRHLKTGLTDLSGDEIALLENYVYLWQMSNRKWKTEWTEHPHGFGAEMTEDDIAELKSINELRARAVAPLEKFSKSLDGADAEKCIKAIMELIRNSGAKEKLRELALSLDADGDTLGAAEQERLWDTLISVLDTLADISKGRKYDAKSLEQVLELMLGTETLGKIPSGLDEVTLGSADRIRLVAPKVVFVVGANLGAFPLAAGGVSALTDRDRSILLNELDIELASFGQKHLAEEKLITYSAFCCAGEKLFLSYISNGSEGGEPAEPVSTVLRLFPECKKLDYACLQAKMPEYFVESREYAFRRMAATARHPEKLWYALHGYFENDSEYAGKTRALENLGDRKHRITDGDAAVKLFGKSMNLSASRIDTFYGCRFRYFCRYGLNASPRKQAEIDQLQKGTINHYVLENLLKSHIDNDITECTAEELKSEIHEILYEYLDRFLGGKEGKSARFMHNFRLIENTLCEVVIRLSAEFRVSAFRPTDFELKIGDGCPIPAYTPELDGGGQIKISGSVDRVDCAEVNGKKYFRVVDYKLSGKKFSLANAINGLNLQMLLYMFAIAKNGGPYMGEANPSGVLYYASCSKVVSAERDANEEAIKKAKFGSDKTKSSGIFIDDILVLNAMENGLEGVFIPVKESSKGLSGLLISLEKLGKLSERLDRLITGMAEELHEGHIAAEPLIGTDKKSPCAYCDYKAVCFWEESIEPEPLDITDKEALSMLGGEEENCDE